MVKLRADERRSTRYENRLPRPKSVRRRHASTASLILLVNRQLIDDCHKFFQFLDSIIVGSSGSRCFTHGLQVLGVGSEGAPGAHNFRGAGKGSSYRKAALDS